MDTPMSPTYHNQSMMYKGTTAMHTSFFWGKDVEFLFAGWPGAASHRGIYVLALAVVFVIAAAAEILSEAPRLKCGRLGPAAGASIHAFVNGARMALLYLIMLSVMSYNIGVFVAAVAGHAVGSFGVKYRVLVAGEAAPPPALNSSPKV